MKATIVIPKNWRQVKRGKVRKGDLFFSYTALAGRFYPIWDTIAEGLPTAQFLCVIRKCK